MIWYRCPRCKRERQCGIDTEEYNANLPPGITRSAAYKCYCRRSHDKSHKGPERPPQDGTVMVRVK